MSDSREPVQDQVRDAARHIAAPAEDEETRFLLVGPARSGTTMVERLLQSHPHVVSFGELFNYEKILWGYGDFHVRFNTPEMHAFRNSRPDLFLDRVFAAADDPKVKAVGFKMVYGHIEKFKKISKNLLLKKLLSIPDLRVVKIRRENVLKLYVSLLVAKKRAEKDMTFNAYRPQDVETRVTVAVDPEEFSNFVKRTEINEYRYDRYFQDKETIEIRYEDVVGNRAKEMGKVMHFLGVEQRPLRLQTFKVRQKPVSEVVENYQDLERKFRGTSFEKYF